MSKNCDLTLCQGSTNSSTLSPRQCSKSLLITKQISNTSGESKISDCQEKSIYKQFPASRYLDTGLEKRKYLHKVKIKTGQELQFLASSDGSHVSEITENYPGHGRHTS